MSRTVRRKQICAVYAILNSETGETYIGSSYDVIRRLVWHQGYINKGCHGNRKIQAAIEEYGPEVFYFVILEECSREVQYETETAWLQSNHPEYNYVYEASFHGVGISRPGKRGQTGRKHSEQSRLLMRINHVGMSGHCHTEETKARMSLQRLGNKYALGNTTRLGIKHTEETKLIMSRKRKEYWERKNSGTNN